MTERTMTRTQAAALAGVPVEALPEWARWVAQDVIGDVDVYAREPRKSPNMKYWLSVGRAMRLGRSAPPADWRECCWRLER